MERGQIYGHFAPSDAEKQKMIEALLRDERNRGEAAEALKLHNGHREVDPYAMSFIMESVVILAKQGDRVAQEVQISYEELLKD